MTRPPRSRPRRRAAAAAAGVVVLAVMTSACDTSPTAATVDGVRIKQTALNEELRLRTANKAYVASVNQAAQSGQSSIGVTGDAPGTYSTRFVAAVLTQLIQAHLIHSYLASQGQAPSSEQLAAARAVDEALFSSVWLSFPAAFRDAEAERDAEHALIEQPTVQPSELLSAYQQLRKYFFSQVCVRSIDVAVTYPDGTLDVSASAGEASDIASQYNLAYATPSLRPLLGRPKGGEYSCYDGAALEAQGPALYNEVLSLGVGQAADPYRTTAGYQIVAVERRTPMPFDTAVQQALTLGILESQGGSDPALATVAHGARVSVNPALGTWNPQTVSITVPSPLGANSATNQ